MDQVQLIQGGDNLWMSMCLLSFHLKLPTDEAVVTSDWGALQIGTTLNEKK